MPLLRKTMNTGWMALLLLTAAPFSAANAQEGDVAQGRKLAGQYCARCHAIGETGDSPHASAPPFRAIAAKGNVEDLQEALAEGITVGHPDMPEFKFTPLQIDDFLAYLTSLTPRAQ
jgi:cytochrome c